MIVEEPLVRTVETVRAYANRFMTVFDDRVIFRGGQPGTHLRIVPAKEGLGVVVLALHEDRVALVKTYRYPLGAWQWGLPRGFSQSDDELETAVAELQEEIGGTPENVRRIGLITPDSGVLGYRVAVVRADFGSETTEPTDTDEVASVRWLPVKELWGLVEAGDIEDSFTLASLALAAAKGELAFGR